MDDGVSINVATSAITAIITVVKAHRKDKAEG